ncbi:MAG TPA: DUF6364 family protein [Thermoanaerobaculia bacterium]|jgi:hypothetical protein
MSSKLTLSVDGEVVRKAKRFAHKRGTSVSRMVEQYLELVSAESGKVEAPPVLRRLRGSLKGSRSADYRRHLRDKYK